MSTTDQSNPAPGGVPPGNAYPPPPGPPPGTAPAGQPATHDPNAPPPQGGYPPPAGAYPPPPGAYPPPHGAYPPPGGYPGYPPPPGPYGYPGYPPPPGHAPPGGQYPYYQYPGYYYPPPPGAPGAPPVAGTPAAGTPGSTPAGAAPAPPAPGAPPAWPPQAPGGAYPPPGAYPQYGAYPPAPTPPMPGATGFPPAPGAVGGFYAPPSGPPPVQYGQGNTSRTPLWYLGTSIPDFEAPPAAHGVQKVPGYDATHDYNALQSAVKVDFGKESRVTKILLNLNVFQMDALADFSIAKSGHTLLSYADHFADTDFRGVIQGLILGPIGYDVHLIHKAVSGPGTKEWVLVEILLNRTSSEMRLLKAAYKLRYGKDLTDKVSGDVSGLPKSMFTMAMNAQRPDDNLPVDPAQVRTDVLSLVNITKTKTVNEEFIQIFVNRSTPHLQTVISDYNKQGQGLSAYIKKRATGCVRDGLLYILHGVKTKRDGRGEWRDAKLLEATMKGLGTKDVQLTYRLIRAHWDHARFERIKTAYQNRYKKPLLNRVKGETSGPFKEILSDMITRGPKQVTMPGS